LTVVAIIIPIYLIVAFTLSGLAIAGALFYCWKKRMWCWKDRNYSNNEGSDTDRDIELGDIAVGLPVRYGEQYPPG